LQLWQKTLSVKALLVFFNEMKLEIVGDDSCYSNFIEDCDVDFSHNVIRHTFETCGAETIEWITGKELGAWDGFVREVIGRSTKKQTKFCCQLAFGKEE